VTAALSLRVYDPEAGELRTVPLDLQPTGRLELFVRGVTGASAIHVEILQDGEVGHRFEVSTGFEDLVPLQVERTDDGRLGLRCAGREVLSLPRDERYTPAMPIRAGDGGPEAVDLVLVIDATARAWVEPEKKEGVGKLRPLLGEAPRWQEQVQLLLATAEALAGSVELTVGVGAFGDHPMPEIRASDLQPGFLFHPALPADWHSRPFDPDDLRRVLSELPPSSGGDFVDALADALARCAELPRRVGSRRIVLVVGDSPGYSLTDPAPAGGNACARERIVEVEADRLHRCGVEIATLYRPLPPEARFEVLDVPRSLYEHAAAQYRSLASRPSLAWEVGAFDPEAAARQLLAPPEALARGATYPVLATRGVEGSAP
jgi:hypothetical protein